MRIGKCLSWQIAEIACGLLQIGLQRPGNEVDFGALGGLLQELPESRFTGLWVWPARF